jgi:hypothetical protein
MSHDDATHADLPDGGEPAEPTASPAPPALEALDAPPAIPAPVSSGELPAPPEVAELPPPAVKAPPLTTPVPDTGPIPGEEWGWVDAQDVVHQKDGALFKGRALGPLKGRSKRTAFAFYVERFQRLEAKTAELEREVHGAANKGRFSDRTARLVEQVQTADALGDFDALFARLEALRHEVLDFQAAQRARKEELIGVAESLMSQTSWTQTADKMKKLQEQWKTLGSASREDDELLWKRFRGALDTFFQRRDENRTQQSHDRSEARRKKEELCVRAEALVESTELDKTAHVMEEMMAEWKAAGWAGRDVEESLWERFRTARGAFFERRRTAQNQASHDREAHKQRKIALCEAAEALVASPDVFGACEQAKQLQSEWKTVGAVPRALSDQLWDRFRGACDKVFARAQDERKHRRTEWTHQKQESVSRKREQAEALRESIARDLGHIDRWRQALEGLKDGGRAEEMRRGLDEKIQGVEERLAQKRARLGELELEIKNAP